MPTTVRTLLASSLLSACCLAGCTSSDSTAFEPPGGAHGASAGEWAARWWQWALAIPAGTNPILDGDCTQGQTGDVFFLAGNFGGTTERSCTVPAGKALFFPVTNMLCYPSPEVPAEGCSTPQTEAELTACAAEAYDTGTTTMTITVDDEDLADPEAYRAASALFSWTTPTDPADQLWEGIGPIPANTCGIPEGDRFGVTDGYWMMLKPLAPGAHTIHFHSKNQVAGSDPFELDITYHITQQ